MAEFCCVKVASDCVILAHKQLHVKTEISNSHPSIFNLLLFTLIKWFVLHLKGNISEEKLYCIDGVIMQFM